MPRSTVRIIPAAHVSSHRVCYPHAHTRDTHIYLTRILLDVLPADGILKVTLPIASRPPRADAEAAAAGQSEVSAAPTGNKGKKRGAETQQPPPSDSAKPAARPEKKAKTAPAAALPAAAAAAAGDESSSKVKPKKKAKFIEQSAALALVDAVNDSVDENVQKQVDTDAAKKKAIQAVQAQKKEKKKEKSDFLEKIQQEKKKRLLQKQRSEIDAPRPAPKKK